MLNFIVDEIFDIFLIVLGMYLLSLEDKIFCIFVLLGVYVDEDFCFFCFDKIFFLFKFFILIGVVFVFKYVNVFFIFCVKSIWF